MRYIYLVFLVFSIYACKPATVDPPEEALLPNFIHIFADDLGYGDIGCFGATDIATPNIDRIAAQGIRFTDFYSASSVCSPSRAGLLTGRMPQRMGINRVYFPESFSGLPLDEVTLADQLKKQGYTCGHVGKWHLGHLERFLPLQRGFDSYYGIPYSNDMASALYLSGNEVDSFEINQAYTTQVYTQKALDFIDENEDGPFFLYLAHNMPHVPIYASPDFLGSSERGLYGDVIQEIDWSVGEILKALEAKGLLENTLIVFSSDNGPWLVMEDHGGSAGPLREGKQFTFDGGMRVPTVAMWESKIPAGQVSTEIASQMDWFPTFSKLAGIPLEKNKAYDGRDLSAVLMGEGDRDGDTYLFYDGEKLEGFRSGNWKLKLPYTGFNRANWKTGVPPHDTLLVNIAENPGEDINLLKNYPDTALLLFQQMDQAVEALGPLPPSQIVRTQPDNSHYEYLAKKRKKNAKQ